MEKITAALNEHIKLELAAWYEYAAMSLWLDMNDLPGCASFLKQQSTDELAHAHRIIDHLTERDQKPILPAIDKPRMYGSSSTTRASGIDSKPSFKGCVSETDKATLCPSSTGQPAAERTTFGKETLKVVPLLTAVSISTFPPKRSVSFLTSDKPKPGPV